MGSMSIWHWLIVLIVVLLVFGSGKISTLMGDLAKGIKIFKKNIAEDETPSSQSKTTKGIPLFPLTIIRKKPLYHPKHRNKVLLFQKRF